MSGPILEIDGLTKRFGGLAAVDGVSMLVREGTIHATVGPNGAGKTTLFHLISGFVAPDAGTIALRGRDITSMPVARRVPLGMVRTFQNIRLFRGMTVRENVLVGQHVGARDAARSLWPSLGQDERARRGEVDDILAALALTDYADRTAGGLPYGIQKRLELARSLAAHPLILLLDEPTAGMNDEESRDIMRHIERLREEGTTVLLVEHDMNVVMGISDVVSVLDFGRLIAEGPPAQIRANRGVQEAYLGHNAATDAS